MTAVQTGTAQAAAAPTLLDRMNPVTRLGLAVLASLPILITLDWVSALTMLCENSASCAANWATFSALPRPDLRCSARARTWFRRA